MESGDFPVPVLYLKFGENQGVEAKDSSPEGNDGDIEGPSWAKGILGPGLSFDGLDDYVSVPDDASFDTASFSVVCWFKLIATAYTSTYFVMRNCLWQATPTGTGWAIYKSGQESRILSFIVQSAEKHLVKSYEVELDRWYHITMTFDGSTNAFNIFIDGENEGSGTLTGAYLLPTSQNLRIMPYIQGLLDEVRVYDVALSARQVLELFYGFE